jgi:hypothetical protein
VGTLKWLQYYTDIIAFTDDTEPTLAQVTETIEQIESEIDGVLKAQGYATVPATGTASIRLLRGYTEREAAYQSYTQVYGVNELPPAIKAWHEDYRGFLARLRRGEQYLPDQSPLTNTDSGMFLLQVLDDD